MNKAEERLSAARGALIRANSGGSITDADMQLIQETLLIAWDFWPLRTGAMQPKYMPFDPARIERGKTSYGPLKDRVERYAYGKLKSVQTDTDGPRVYFPTEADLNVILDRYPDTDPRTPDFQRITTDLTAHDYRPADLAAMTAPAIIESLGQKPTSAPRRAMTPTESAADWIKGNDAGDIVGINLSNIGRAANRGKIIDNGKTHAERRYLRSSVCKYAAERYQRIKRPVEEESTAAVKQKFKRTKS